MDHSITRRDALGLMAAAGVNTLIGWNPTANPQTVQFFQGSKPLGKLEVPPHSIGSGVQPF